MSEEPSDGFLSTDFKPRTSEQDAQDALAAYAAQLHKQQQDLTARLQQLESQQQPVTDMQRLITAVQAVPPGTKSIERPLLDKDSSGLTQAELVPQDYYRDDLASAVANMARDYQEHGPASAKYSGHSIPKAELPDKLRRSGVHLRVVTNDAAGTGGTIWPVATVLDPESYLVFDRAADDQPGQDAYRVVGPGQPEEFTELRRQFEQALTPPEAAHQTPVQ